MLWLVPSELSYVIEFVVVEGIEEVLMSLNSKIILINASCVFSSICDTERPKLYPFMQLIKPLIVNIDMMPIMTNAHNSSKRVNPYCTL